MDTTPDTAATVAVLPSSANGSAITSASASASATTLFVKLTLH